LISAEEQIFGPFLARRACIFLKLDPKLISTDGNLAILDFRHGEQEE